HRAQQGALRSDCWRSRQHVVQERGPGRVLPGGPKGTLESPVSVLLLSSEGPLLGTGRDRAPNRGLGWQVHPRRQDQGSPFQWSISPDRGIRAGGIAQKRLTAPRQ